MKKTASYLSMENLDLNEEENNMAEEEESHESDEEGKKSKFLTVGREPSTTATNGNSNTIDQESVCIDPTFILNKGFQKVTAVGSSTALVAIRN
jgi:hypothetical protein